MSSYFITHDTKNKTEAAQKAILIHSVLYYDLSRPVISDQAFDVLVARYKKQKLQKSRFSYVFGDFDGTTSEYLRYRLTPEDKEYIMQEADACWKASYEKITRNLA